MPPTYDVPEVVAVISDDVYEMEHPTQAFVLIGTRPPIPPAYAVPDTAELVMTS